ncbi:MAG: hypothetical protein IAG10_02375 [Planctomycetaceae bacterium]|nr:hypothetical protein [Planctomycetaceae bacterium]
MAEHSFDPPADDFTAETELLRGANTLPTLSSRLRDRVLNAATSAYRQARRWSQARQAASFLSFCLLASFVLSPIANSSFPNAAWEHLTQSFDSPIDLASHDSLSTPQERNSAWSLSHDHEFLDLPLKSKFENRKSKTENPISQLIAHVEPSPPRDKLLTTLHTSDGWATVQAFQAVRSRSHSTLQRAFAAN